MRKLLAIIILLGVFFRTYQLVSFHEYSHEQDLQSFIVKDIVLDKHLRLVGQETSITGVFVGPLFYYSLIPFYLLTSMDPIGAVGLTLIISVLTILSVFYVLNKLYSKQTGLIGAFIYATSLPIAIQDRWVVPTQTTLLFTIWYFYTLISLTRGNFKVLPILIILLGLIWHVHIAFIPLLILLPIAALMSHKKISPLTINRRQLMLSIAIFILLVSPLLVFEVRHGFQQLHGIIKATQGGSTVLYGEYKFETLLINITRVLKDPLFNTHFPEFPRVWIIPGFTGIFILLSVSTVRLKILAKKELLIIYLWIANILISHQLSLRPIAGYYFNSLLVLATVIYGLLGSWVWNKNKLLAAGLLSAFLLINLHGLYTRPKKVGEYQDRKAVVQYIQKDASTNSYKCVAINYIGAVGTNYGFRFLFERFGPRIISPGNDVPTYSLAIPNTISENEVDFSSGNIGVLLPDVKGIDPSACSDPKRQLLPLNGFVN